MNPEHSISVREALLELAPARASVYEFVSTALLQPPAPELLQVLATIPAPAHGAAEFHETIADALSTLSKHATEAMASDSQRQRLRQDYMDLFRVPGGSYVAPYESVYRDTREIEGQQVKGLLLGPSALDAQKWYRLAAAEMESHTKELPDHIGVELAFVAYLCRKEEEFATGGNTAPLEKAWRIERDFICEHIMSWARQLTSNVRSKTKIGFYSALLDLALALAQQDVNLLDLYLLAKTDPD